MNDLIFTQAARLILLLDHLFLEAKPISNDEISLRSAGEQFVQRLFALYTAQLLCWLLIHTFSSKSELNYDKWIWHPILRIKKMDGVIVERTATTCHHGCYRLEQNINQDGPSSLSRKSS